MCTAEYCFMVFVILCELKYLGTITVLKHWSPLIYFIWQKVPYWLILDGYVMYMCLLNIDTKQCARFQGHHNLGRVYLFLFFTWVPIVQKSHCLSCWMHSWALIVNTKESIGPFTLAKTKIQKTWVFCCTVYTARKTHSIQGFWHEKRMREKTRISYLCFGKWCACATSLYLWPYTCSAHYVAGRGRVIPLKVTYHVTKNPSNTGEIGASVYIGKKPVKFQRSFKKSRCGGGFFDSVLLECLGEVA